MLTLIVPGLLWPQQALADLTNDLSLPAFATLLGRGRLRRGGGQTLSTCVAAETGMSDPLPAAALRHIELGAEPYDGPLLCLDPVHLRFEDRTLIVDDPRQLALGIDESLALAVSLAPTFEALGELVVLEGGRWNLRLRNPAPTFPALPEAIARAAEPLSLKPEFAPWRKAINEAQMVLHGHPINQAREAAKRPVVNSLWPWGGGDLSGVHSQTPIAIFADDPGFRGIARVRGQTSGKRPTGFATITGSTEGTLLILDILITSARLGQGLQWRESLLNLEQEWLQPALTALRSGRLSSLRLLMPDSSQSIALVIRRTDLWKIWRSDKPLTHLASP